MTFSNSFRSRYVHVNRYNNIISPSISLSLSLSHSPSMSDFDTTSQLNSLTKGVVPTYTILLLLPTFNFFFCFVFAGT